MDYLLFTLPGCLKCDALKALLAAQGMSWQEFNLVNKDAKMKLREFREIIKRDESGAVILPTLVLVENDAAVGIVNTAEELEAWWQSRA